MLTTQLRRFGHPSRRSLRRAFVLPGRSSSPWYRVRAHAQVRRLFKDDEKRCYPPACFSSSRILSSSLSSYSVQAVEASIKALKNSIGTTVTMSEVLDDKAPYVVPFILSNLKRFEESTRVPEGGTSKRSRPFFIGLNGVQGAGKSVLVDIIQTLLQSPPYNLSTVVFSLDDLYLTHDDQVALARANPSNPLLQHRGQPSTHDIKLALDTFRSLKEGNPTKIPEYNKAAFSGQGDRIPSTEWRTVNTDPNNPTKVVLFEGWCVGFRPLSSGELQAKHSAAVQSLEMPISEYKGRLGHNTLASVTTINEALRQYDAITDQLDAFLHIDAADPQFVYRWRLQQEEGLRHKKGSGMTDEQVKTFVDGYYPAYELYTMTLREGVFKPRRNETETEHVRKDWEGRQLRLIVGEDRKVREAIAI